MAAAWIFIGVSWAFGVYLIARAFIAVSNWASLALLIAALSIMAGSFFVPDLWLEPARTATAKDDR